MDDARTAPPALRRLRPPRLHTQIAVFGALLLAAVIGAYTWYTVRGQTEVESAALDARVQALAANVATASATFLVTRRYSEIEELLLRMAWFPDVLQIQVTDMNGRVLSAIVRPGGEGAPAVSFDFTRLTPPDDGKERVERDAERLVIWRPIVVGALIGWVRLEYSLDSIAALQARIVSNGILVGLLSTTLGAVLFWLALLPPVRAVQRATQFAARLDELRGRPYPVEHGTHEVEQLGQALNNVSLKLAEQEQALSATSRRLQAVLQHVIEGIITIDERGRIESLNPAAERMFGYTADEILGQPFTRLAPDFLADGSQDADPLPRPKREAAQMEFELSAVRKDGSTFPLQIGLSSMQIEDHTLFIGIVRDITEQKRLEQMKNRFFSSVSHELRTPLTSLHGALGLMAGGDVEGIAPKADPLVKMAYKNSSRLVGLINDIFDIENVESGQMAFATRVADLVPLVREAIEEAATHARLHNVAIVLEAPPAAANAFIDPDRLKRVLVRLLANAVRLSPPGDRVHVAVARTPDGMLRIGITDHGPGVPPEARKYVFQKFVQWEAGHSRYEPNADMGLSLAKAIVDRLGGRIDFESVPGEVTTFFVEFPEVAADIAAD